ncbi:MAG: 3-phosphoglycerate dehydrogenase [Chloroflexi bacterium]|nr:3-phosphoglycerate dehydrogenase [Chloroflexota bacterium]
MRALILAPFDAGVLELLNEHIPVTYEPWTETRRLYAPADLARRIKGEEVGAVIVEADFLFDEVFDAAPPLRFVGICRAATNHVDLEAATEKGVVVVNTPGRNARAVAELTLGLMLCLARHIPLAHEYVKEGAWQEPTEAYTRWQGLELSGRVLGIVGLGAVGRTVARLARGMGMRVMAYDPYVQAFRGVEMASLEELLRESDFVSLHAPASSETEGLINAERLALMRPAAYLINVANPSLVDEGALAKAVESRSIAGAALDVFGSHPVPPSSPLLCLTNVVLTPHIGGATAETVERHSRMVAEDLLRFLEGKRPRRLVNPQAWRRRGR